MLPELTLVPEGLAQEGYTFRFMGDPKAFECEGCPVRNVCFRLEAGRSYKVVEVRDVAHICELHDGGRVRVCRVEEVDIQLSVPAKDLRGTATHWSPPACRMPECPSYGFCHPVGPEVGGKMEIVRVGNPLDCPAGFDLRRATVRPMT